MGGSYCVHHMEMSVAIPCVAASAMARISDAQRPKIRIIYKSIDQNLQKIWLMKNTVTLVDDPLKMKLQTKLISTPPILVNVTNCNETRIDPILPYSHNPPTGQASTNKIQPCRPIRKLVWLLTSQQLGNLQPVWMFDIACNTCNKTS